MRPDDATPEPVAIVNAALNGSKKFKDRLEKDHQEAYRAYRGILDLRSKAATWENKQAPPYVFQIIDTIVGGHDFDTQQLKGKPRSRRMSREAAVSLKEAARYQSEVVRDQFSGDQARKKIDTHALQASTGRISFSRLYWRTVDREVTRLRTVDLAEEYELVEPLLAQKPTPVVERVHDDPTMEPIDLRDCWWPEGARTLEEADWFIQRSWLSKDAIERLVKVGVYKREDVDRMEEASEHSSGNAGMEDWEQELYNISRTKDMFEVHEYWTGERFITVGNREVLLRDEDNPFWHKRKPFLAVQLRPELFSLMGVSDVELLKDLQEMVWSLANQRLDNLELVNNAIIMLREDIMDKDSFVWGPREQWEVPDKDAVTMWTPDVTAAQVSMPAEQALRGDMQNVTGAMPFVGGTDSGMDQETATGVSIVTQLAQQRVTRRRQRMIDHYSEVAEFFSELNRQFIRGEFELEVDGPGGEEDFIIVTPEHLAPMVEFEYPPADESMMREQRQAAATARFQLFVNAAPVFAELGTPLNPRAFLDDYLEAFDVTNTDAYILSPDQAGQLLPDPAGQAGGAPPPQSQVAGGPAPPNLGVTNSQAADANNPADAINLSPQLALNRARALSNGGG